MAQPKKEQTDFGGVIMWMLIGIFTMISVGCGLAKLHSFDPAAQVTKCEAKK